MSEISLKGIVFKFDKYWLIEVPLADAMTQGESREDAFHMLKDYIESDLDEKVTYEVIDNGSKDFEIKFDQSSNIVPWIFKRMGIKVQKDFHLEKYEALGVAYADDLKNVVLKLADRIRELEKKNEELKTRINSDLPITLGSLLL